MDIDDILLSLVFPNSSVMSHIHSGKKTKQPILDELESLMR